tara:strand:+ start:520 stop:750 length:231 start_codon:yes stop_codon:yes gene_type:complete
MGLHVQAEMVRLLEKMELPQQLEEELMSLLPVEVVAVDRDQDLITQDYQVVHLVVDLTGNQQQLEQVTQATLVEMM